MMLLGFEDLDFNPALVLDSAEIHPREAPASLPPGLATRRWTVETAVTDGNRSGDFHSHLENALRPPPRVFHSHAQPRRRMKIRYTRRPERRLQSHLKMITQN